MLKQLFIIGAGGLGRKTLTIARDILQNSDRNWEINGFLDDNLCALDEFATDGFRVVDTISSHRISPNNLYTCAIADSAIRKKICLDFLNRGAVFLDLIHPSCQIGYTAKYGKGLIMAGFSSISENATIGDFAIINTATNIGHDVAAGDYCTFSPQSNVTGYVKLGEGVFLGSSAVITPNVTVGDGARVGAGAIVLKDVNPYTTVFGNPAKTILSPKR